ncbi:hypothetical protein L1987_78296 [Smallanthus sonchifolius]|uniref:Uncharacterized protein n=1 Tax=Smallanthus sonchifolius TaxID=185202 RepID=A0ACB8ZC21_9ASTR|nr:hypothetical protein L1987_78296 [Smallanthus sonchifolius]
MFLDHLIVYADEDREDDIKKFLKFGGRRRPNPKGKLTLQNQQTPYSISKQLDIQFFYYINKHILSSAIWSSIYRLLITVNFLKLCLLFPYLGLGLGF